MRHLYHAIAIFVVTALLVSSPAAAQRSSLAPIQAQADGKSTETVANISFDKCKELMSEKIEALKANPMGIISVLNSSYMKIVRVCTDPGDVLFTCSEADQWLVVTTSPMSADRRCK